MECLKYDIGVRHMFKDEEDDKEFDPQLYYKVDPTEWSPDEPPGALVAGSLSLEQAFCRQADYKKTLSKRHNLKPQLRRILRDVEKFSQLARSRLPIWQHWILPLGGGTPHLLTSIPMPGVACLEVISRLTSSLVPAILKLIGSR